MFTLILELTQITDNKLFWKTIKPFLSHKSIQSSTITIFNKTKQKKKDPTLIENYKIFERVIQKQFLSFIGEF